MTISTDRTVRELVNEYPFIISVFTRYGIDFCCGGGKTLAEACQNASTTTEIVLDAVEQAKELEAARTAEHDWTKASLSDLIWHINRTHHVYVRNETARIQTLLAKVPEKHGTRHPELFIVRDLFATLAAELAVHMMKEEQILFPYVIRLEESVIAGEPNPPSSCFGSVENPIRMMEHEHEGAGDILRQLRHATDGYQAPEDGCTSFRSLYQALADFEADLHMHIHLENNVLFPRAVEASLAHV